jgi:Dockerin type I domain
LVLTLTGATFAADPTIAVDPFSTAFAVLSGDFNGDGVVNRQDLVGVRNEMQGTGDASQIGWADLDGNGTVNINDYNAVRRNVSKHMPRIGGSFSTRARQSAEPGH